jgi:hypothetical protein
MVVLRTFRKRGRIAQFCNSRIKCKRETEGVTNYICIYRHGIGDYKEDNCISIPIDKAVKGEYVYNTGLFEMIFGVLTTCHTQYTWDSSM